MLQENEKLTSDYKCQKCANKYANNLQLQEIHHQLAGYHQLKL